MSQFKKKLTAFGAMLAFLSVSTVATFAAGLGDVANQTGNIGIKGDDTLLNVDLKGGVNGAVGQVDWNQFDVPGGQTVNFGFSGLSQTIINRVLGGQTSQIMGHLTNSCISGGSCTTFAQTGKVILINPAGVVFGAGSTVDLNSFTVSTFDINGAKNLRDVTDEATYLAGFRNGTGRDAKGNSYNYAKNITFDSNYSAGGLTPLADAGITFDGTTFDHFGADVNTNKTIAAVSDNITYKNSVLKTGDNYNYGTGSYGRISLITADGVNFKYLVNGYENSNAQKNTIDTKAAAAEPQRVIDIQGGEIRSGRIDITNQSSKAGSDIKIKDAVIKGTKLVNAEPGTILIQGDHDINIEHSRLQTVNTRAVDQETGAELASTRDQNGGEITIIAKGSATVDNSLLATAGNNDTAAANGDNANTKFNAGSVRVYAYGDKAELKNNTRVLAEGNVEIVTTSANGTVKVDNSSIKASNSQNTTRNESVYLWGPKQVEITDSAVQAAGDVDIEATSLGVEGNPMQGNVIISSTGADGRNKTVIKAGDSIYAYGKETTLDKATLAYDNLHFYGADAEGTNNLTIKGENVFIQNGAAGNVDITTNGNISLANSARIKSGSQTITLGSENDTTPIDAFQFSTEVTPDTAQNITFTTTNGNFSVDGYSNMTATNDVTISAANGSVTFTDNNMKVVDAGRDLSITAKNDINVGKMANAGAGRNISLTSNEGNISMDRYMSSMGSNLTANGDITLRANKKVDIKSSNQGALKAGGSVNLTSDTDNVSIIGVYGPGNKTIDADKNVTITSTVGDVSLANAQITAGRAPNADGTPASTGNIVITGKDLNDSNSTLGAYGNLNVIATGEVDIYDSTYAAYPGDGDNKGNIDIKAGEAVTISGNSTYFTASNDLDITSGNWFDISDASFSAGHDINMTSLGDIRFGQTTGSDVEIASNTSFNAGNNLNFKTTGSTSNIKGDKATLASMQYGNRLKFDAAGDNEFTSSATTSDGSFKAVNVDYVAGGSNSIIADNDIQLVNSTVKGQNNVIQTTNEGGDVILNNFKIMNSDAVTTILAKGNVTTSDVTGTFAADSAARGEGERYSYVNDVNVTFDVAAAKAEDTTKTALDVNGSKVKIETSAAKSADVDEYGEPMLNDNGSIVINVKNANSSTNGLELIAQNAGGWDGASDPGYGPEVHLDADDNVVSISKIVTDKLTLDSKDSFIAAPFTPEGNELTNFPEGTQAKGYIEVRDYMGFNMDTDFGVQPEDFDYTGHYQIGKVDTLVDGETDAYQKHTIEFKDSNDQFLLVYNRPVNDCPTVLPPVDRTDDIDDSSVDSLINTIKIPREQQEISNFVRIRANMADQTSNIMSAAAKVEAANSATGSKDTTSDESIESDSAAQ